MTEWDPKSGTTTITGFWDDAVSPWREKPHVTTVTISDGEVLWGHLFVACRYIYQARVTQPVIGPGVEGEHTLSCDLKAVSPMQQERGTRMARAVVWSMRRARACWARLTGGGGGEVTP